MGVADSTTESEIRVFISSTKLDLKDYRKHVIDAVNRLERQTPVRMECFTTTGDDATELSFEQLDSCNVFVGIIGHRYGTIPPGEDKSITHLEFERAVELRRQRGLRILMFVADRMEVPLIAELQEDDRIRAKYQEFRKAIELNHAPETFVRPSTLAVQVVTALQNRLPRIRPTEEPTVFSEGQAADVFGDADGVADERRKTIQRLLEFMAGKFDSLFRLNSKRLRDHPLFGSVQDMLEPLIPGVAVHEESGILMRSHMRHVILRTNTLLTIFCELSEEQLFNFGLEIGKNAAWDLVDQTLRKRRVVPSSPRALVELWDYWDSTGGWGKLSLMADNEFEEESDTSDELGMAPTATWYVKVQNNFLMVQGEIEETRRLCRFWCGYIHGFLSKALPLLSEMMEELRHEQRLKIMLPAYHRVESVTQEPDDSIDVDVFRVHFQEEAFSKALHRVGRARHSLRQKEFEKAVLHCTGALQHTRTTMGEQGRSFGEEVDELEMSGEQVQLLRQFLKSEIEHYDQETVEAYVALTHEVVTELSSKKQASLQR